MNDLAALFLSAAFVENMPLTFFLGLCTFIALSRRPSSAVGLGVAMMAVLGVTVPLNHLIYTALLAPGAWGWAGMPALDLSYLSLIAFIGVIAAVVQLLFFFNDPAFTEIYTALQTGAVDGQDNPLPTVRDSKFYEVTKQIVLTSHLVDLNYIAFSKKVWDSLTPDQQATVQKAADDAAESGRQKQLALETELEQFFKDKGLKVYTPDVDAFRSHVQKMYMESEFSKTWPEGMVDKINAL